MKNKLDSNRIQNFMSTRLSKGKISKSESLSSKGFNFCLDIPILTKVIFQHQVARNKSVPGLFEISVQS